MTPQTTSKGKAYILDRPLARVTVEPQDRLQCEMDTLFGVTPQRLALVCESFSPHVNQPNSHSRYAAPCPRAVHSRPMAWLVSCLRYIVTIRADHATVAASCGNPPVRCASAQPIASGWRHWCRVGRPPSVSC